MKKESNEYLICMINDVNLFRYTIKSIFNLILFIRQFDKNLNSEHKFVCLILSTNKRFFPITMTDFIKNV